MPSVTGLGHVGLFVKDPDVMVEFYSTFLGMTVSDRGEDDRIVFLSARPDQEHHELVLSKDPSRRTELQQLSFTVGSLADLREFHAQIKARGYPIDRVVSHGNAFGCYFRDPEGNQVEVYWPTGKIWPQPYGENIDLERPEEELLSILR
jgi:catechol 2,3-dioxygenase-like lactoylglutathione lyase family enzyme